MGNTTRLSIPKLVSTDPPRADTDVNAALDDIDNKMAYDMQGTIASRPAAAIRGRFYTATDQSNTVYRDTGSTWVEIYRPNSFVQPGTIMYWPENTASPSGWLDCDGSAVSRSTYANMFANTSTQYGVGDGSTTFNLPDMNRKDVTSSYVSNSTFDTNTTGWTLSPTVGTITRVASGGQGNNSGYLSLANSGGGGSGDWRHLMAKALTSGYEYELSFWIKKISGTGTMDIGGDPYGEYGTAYMYSIPTGTTDWTELKVRFQVAMSNNVSTTTNIYYGNVYVQPLSFGTTRLDNPMLYSGVEKLYFFYSTSATSTWGFDSIKLYSFAKGLPLFSKAIIKI